MKRKKVVLALISFVSILNFGTPGVSFACVYCGDYNNCIVGEMDKDGITHFQAEVVSEGIIKPLGKFENVRLKLGASVGEAKFVTGEKIRVGIIKKGKSFSLKVKK